MERWGIWIDKAEKTDWIVIDTENFFYRDRKEYDMPNLLDGRTFEDALEGWADGEGLDSKAKIRVVDMPSELRNHVEEWQNYCFAFGIQIPHENSLIWTELREGHATRESVGALLLSLCQRSNVVFHNALHDTKILNHNWGIRFPEDYKRVDDSMLIHNLQYSEMKHDLNTVQAIYSTLNRSKQLGTHSVEYLQADVYATAQVYWNLNRELGRDEGSRWVYENHQLPLLPILYNAHQQGIRLDQRELSRLYERFQEVRNKCETVANEYTGGINLKSSTQLNEWLFDRLGLKITGLRKSPKSGYYPTNKDVISALQEQILPTFDDDTFESRLERGGNPLVEAKAYYSYAQQMVDSYVKPLLGLDRCYPNFGIHQQSTGRWSTTNPNVAQWNEEIKSVIVPDPGESWYVFDWSNAELRIMADLTEDLALQTAFAKDWDLHSMHTSQAFGWDSVKGRLAWAKQFKKKVDESSIDMSKSQEGWWGRIGPKDWKKNTVPVDYNWTQWVNEGGPHPGWDGDKDLFRRFSKILCVPMDTLCLTRRGWKRHDELIIGEEVMTYNAEKGIKEWSPLLAVNYFESTPIVRMKNKHGWNIRCTAEHRWFVKQRREGSFSIRYSENQIRTTSELNSESNIIVNAPLIDNTPDSGLGYWIPEDNYERHHGNLVERVLNMSQAERKAWLGGFLQGEGTVCKGRKGSSSWSWSQNRGETFEAALVASFLETGMKVNVTQGNPPSHSPNGKECMKVQINRKSHVTNQKTVFTEEEAEPVWCPTTANGSWVMRQGDCITITGNCFRLMYGASTSSAKSIPGAVSLGLPLTRLVQASKDLILAHPEWQEYWTKVGAQAEDKWEVRNPFGRCRRLMNPDRASRFRAGINFPIQSSVSDLLNRTVIRVMARAPWARLVCTIHDSCYFGAPTNRIEELRKIVDEEATRPLWKEFYIPVDGYIKYGKD